MGTQAFKTQSGVFDVTFPSAGENKTVIAIDGGYSAVKAIGERKGCIFPSYAKEIPETSKIVGNLAHDAILLRDNITHKLWAVGSLAEEMIDRKDLDETTDEYLYQRYRYQTELFRTIISAGLGICLEGTDPENEVYVQTGLPSAYARADKDELLCSLSGEYNFDIKVGNSVYRHIELNVPKEHISVIEQPQGTLFSTVFDKDGEQINNRVKILSSSAIVYDIGFNTEDEFVIRNGVNSVHKTYLDTGMKTVFQKTIDNLNREYGTDFKVFEFQKFLEKGSVRYFDRKTHSTKEIPFEKELRKNNELICNKSVERLMTEFDDLLNYRYLIVTGGTGESRFAQIKDMLSGIHGLTVLAGNENDTSLPFSFSNCRGYYMYRYQMIKRGK
jgi:plasmid segregation protein ParM